MAAETDFEMLKRKALVLESENERLVKKVTALLKENLQLKGMAPEQLQGTLVQIDEYLARVKGGEDEKRPSSEKRGHSAETQEKKTKKGHGPRAQPRLPVETVTHPLDEADQVCSVCGGQLMLWEGQADESEEVDVIERRFVLRKHVWPKYRCKCGGCVEQALAEPKVVPGGRYSNDFAIEVAIDKYLDHQPLERQARIFQREGLDTDSQTLWDQLNALARLLAPLMGRLRAMALAAKVLGFDETRWPVLSKAARKAWTMWQLSTAHVVYFAIAPSRDKVEGGRFLDGFTGIALGDAAAVHRCMARQLGFTLAYCWAHARRYFIAAENSEPVRTAQFLEMVQRLYIIDAQAPPGVAGDEMRLQLRREKSRPVLEEIRQWLDAQRFLPTSAFGTAMTYVAGHWHGLNVFLENPQVPLDNNRTERGFRAPALGRHNFYGSKSKRGTEVAALFYSLFETAKLNGVEPKRYLKLAVKAALAGEVIPLPHELAKAA